MNIINAFEKSLGEYDRIQKSNHWKKYDRRKHLYTVEHLKDFRNNDLSEGLDPSFPPDVQQEIYEQLVADVGEDYVLSNLSDKNIGNAPHLNVFEHGGLFIDGGQNYIIRWLYDLEVAVFSQHKIGVVCEIGGGYGAMAQKIRSRFGCKLILIDLPEANVLSAYYLSQHFPDARFLLADDVQGKRVTLDDVMRHDIIIIPPWYSLADEVMVDLFINTRSFMEMNKKVIGRYFDLIQRHTKVGGFFFNLNRYQKKSVGYPIKFAEYPYDKRWGLVVSKGAWRQDDHHFLITRRFDHTGDIVEGIRSIARRGARYIPRVGTWQKVKDAINRVRFQR